MRLFVTGTGTDIGKTYVSCGMLRQRPIRALKPVMSGYDPARAAESDAGRLLTAQGSAPSADAVAAMSPWRFSAPLSPDMAARHEGRAIDFDALVDFCKSAGPALIEGVGGVMVPLDDRHTVLDWIAALDIPVLLVCGSYLGALSHTLTALRCLRVAAIAVNETAFSPVDIFETAAVLARFSDAPIHIVRRGATDFASLSTLLGAE